MSLFPRTLFNLLAKKERAKLRKIANTKNAETNSPVAPPIHFNLDDFAITQFNSVLSLDWFTLQPSQALVDEFIKGNMGFMDLRALSKLTGARSTRLGYNTDGSVASLTLSFECGEHENPQSFAHALYERYTRHTNESPTNNAPTTDPKHVPLKCIR